MSREKLLKKGLRAWEKSSINENRKFSSCQCIPFDGHFPIRALDLVYLSNPFFRLAVRSFLILG